ncbi:hypothetical protein KFL_001720030 [Klebsormidium nitens]|uniref:Uncharacterized protein n=1 Tax=Klebsormidium nitens TaxID=105231 RepID=A0A0U9HT47_KLENI|nr:hypothetical protein KFL_001720030 [Klebsormidium nitens]|eukprot:GAQ83990.1 hypothetical protein KFL_001720030 [Klebsormidium nitens]
MKSEEPGPHLDSPFFFAARLKYSATNVSPGVGASDVNPMSVEASLFSPGASACDVSPRPRASVLSASAEASDISPAPGSSQL